ncbi:hypothetical protein [Micromonospora chersina]|uniref:hypothetical protein n=1 Tax=Micromonospora chersina TaxID=47854 RepID=UPI00371BD65A
MYHHAKRPTPLLCGIAGSVCAIGVIAITARILNAYTTFSLAEPFDTLSFILAVVCWPGGPAMVGWLWNLSLKRRNAELLAENQRLHKECDERESLAGLIRSCDQQGEVNTVLLRKILKTVEEKQIPLGDTQDIPRLHSINGGGGA